MDYLSYIKKSDDVKKLYQSVDWYDFLGCDENRLNAAMKNSWYVVYVYDKDLLIGTGRVVSDGLINAYLCGICVHPDYRKQGIGAQILNRLVNECNKSKLHIQLLCEDDLEAYYIGKGFETFAIGMKYRGNNESI